MSNQVFYILVINPGSTSLKMALYKNEKKVHQEQINYSSEQIAVYKKVNDQFTMRLEDVMKFIETMPISKDKLSAIACRGGSIVPLKSGAYLVNELMVDRLKNRAFSHHASNMGGMLGFEVAKLLGINAYIYDGVSASEIKPLAYPTGFSGITRESRVHFLNMHAMLLKTAEILNREPNEINVIMAHLGGGITLSIFEKGRMIDTVLDTEGPFTPERAGRIPLNTLVRFCINNRIPVENITKRIRGGGGLVSLLGTNNTLEVELRIKEGDLMAKFIYETMAYQVSKSIGELATVTYGKVDQIVLTGAIAHSKMFTDWIIERVSFLANVLILPGENELDSLNQGILRVLRGEEVVHEYTNTEEEWENTFQLSNLLDEYKNQTQIKI